MFLIGKSESVELNKEYCHIKRETHTKEKHICMNSKFIIKPI